VALEAPGLARRIVRALALCHAGQHAPQVLERELAEVDDGHPGDVQRRQHLGDVACERGAGRHDAHAFRDVALRVLKVQPGGPVQADGRLAGARAAANDDHARAFRRDGGELCAVDEGGDLGEVVVHPSRLGPAQLRCTQGRARAAGQATDLDGDRPPGVVRQAHPLLLSDADPHEPAALHGDRAARLDHPGADVAAEVLLVLVTLFVAVEDA
jgi:hypothetical protein